MSMLFAILCWAILAYLAWGVGFQFCYAVLGRFWSPQRWGATDELRPIRVLIPAYREDAVIVETAKAALIQAYPAEQYEVVILADSLLTETLDQLRKLPIRVEEVTFEQSTKARALNEVLPRLAPQPQEIMVILDADNHMSQDFLIRINAAFAQGVRILQGQRAAKNTDTTMAALDGLSEAVNNHMLCKGHTVAGLSARLAGSGMAFDGVLFREVMPQIDAIGGFDKELELRLTRSGETVIYDEDAIIYDEKVRKGDHFSRQRSRWIAAQFYYARHFFPAALKRGLLKGQWDHLNKASQMLLPPRLLTPGILLLGSLLLWLLGFQRLSMAWGIIFVFNIATFLISMPAYAWRSPYREALLRVPIAFWHAARSLIGIRQANKKFIHTPHGEAGGHPKSEVRGRRSEMNPDSYRDKTSKPQNLKT